MVNSKEYEEKELDKNSTISKMEIVEKKEIGMLIENQNFIIWMLLLQLDIELILRKQQNLEFGLQKY